MSIYDMFFGRLAGISLISILKVLGIIALVLAIIVSLFTLESWEWIIVGIVVAICVVLGVMSSVWEERRRKKDENS